nr:EOG090X04O4 [Cyclestheria hislopi]
MAISLKLTIICLSAYVLCVFGTANDELVIKNVDRAIDVSSQLVKISHRLTLQNNGKSTIKQFSFPIQPDARKYLSFLKAKLLEGKDSILKTTEKDINQVPTWIVDLKEGLEPGKTVKVRVDTVFAHHLKPHPAEISQKEKQLVTFQGSAYLYSPYKVTTQTTKVVLSSSNIENFTKVKPTTQSDSSITYGPYDDIPPMTEESIVIHYENNNPFLTVSSLVRHIEISHWGNIAVEETIDVYHSGARLKGSFSRFEYQREQSGVSSVKSFKTLLPPSAADVYYRDEIGNISTSNLKEGEESVELEIRPRFPLFGGWKTHYVIGYNVPSYEFLYNSGDQFVLQMKLVDHVFDDMIIENALVRIVLPEGAQDIEIETPYTVQRLSDSVHYTYLDTMGRPVIQLSAKNLVENHIQDFKLRYRFSRIQMLQEPLLCVLAFLCLFGAVIIYVRLDFSITKDEANENRLRVAGIAETVVKHQQKRSALYHQYEEQLNKFKQSKDSNAFQAALKNIQAELKSETQAIDASAQLKGEGASLAEKVNELQKLDKNLREALANLTILIEKLVNGKTNKQQFIELEGPLTKKKEDLLEKINNLVVKL